MSSEKKRIAGRWAARIAAALAVVLFLGLGIWRGEPAIVLNKAINICMECIGLG
ncbi:MAG: CD1871A family CXXC motif-containing protein [Eubacteriales bacterium]|nr:CD1871A family CXXC motif-containing protein [Eubacteriales bacterium]